MRVVFAILTILLFLENTSFSASRVLGSRTEMYTIENGLSQSYVNHLFIDSRGFLWISTYDGLNRFDGLNFVVYKHNPIDTNSLSDNYVRHVCEDRDGNIWVATNNGLSCYLFSKGIFVNYYNDPQNASSISSNSVFNVFCDKNDVIWVKTLTSLEKFDKKQQKFYHYYHHNDIFNHIIDDRNFDIFEDSREKLWIATKDGLSCFDKRLELFEHFSSDPSDVKTISDNRVRSICEDYYGNIWVATANGLNKFDIKQRRFYRIYAGADNAPLISDKISSLFTTDKKKIFVGTESGLSILNINNMTFVNYPFFNIQNREIPLSNIKSMLLDKANNLWIGCREGLIKVDLKPLKFGLFRSSGGAFSENISSIYVQGENDAWLGTWNNGLLRVNLEAEKYFSSGKAATRYFSNTSIYSLHKDKNNKLWISTENGLTIFNLRTNIFEPFKPKNKTPYGFSNEKIYCFYEESSKIWMGTKMGLLQYDNKLNEIQLFSKIPDSTGVQVNSAYCLTKDKSGTLWIGTNDGLIRFNPETREYKKYLSSPHYAQNALCSNTIYSLCYTSKGELWIGTNAGLCKYNEERDDFIIYSEVDGLPNNTIYAILEDQNNNLWLSSNKGLILLELPLGSFTSFDQADGLQSFEFNHAAAYKDNTGCLYFGGINGLNYFYPDSLKPNKHIPTVQIILVEIIGNGIRRISALNDGKVISIPANTKLFTINFASLDFTFPSNNQYMYKLSSKKSEGMWINNGTKSFVQYSNLPEGRYYFRVKGSNSDKTWSINEYSLILQVEAPWYKRKFAYFFYFILSALLIYGTVQLRTRKLIKTNKELVDKEKVAQKIARQKEELTLKNKSITDSINYAKRIQEAMMPSEKYLKRILPNSFVFHKPKDIVSGDFAWVSERDGKVLVAAVDCTGHGVPGAFMSILGIELFRNIPNLSWNSPGAILKQINDEFVHIFSDMEDVSLRDGMDVALCIIDKTNYSVHFAGAVNPLYLVTGDKLEEIKGSRFSISIEKRTEEIVFEDHVVQLKKGDMIYIFSDGYADQFGGYEGKKFKFRRFRHLLLNISQLPLDNQKDYLHESIENWRGAHEQVDDLLVIGIKADFE